MDNTDPDVRTGAVEDEGVKMTGTNGTTVAESPYEATANLKEMPLLSKEAIFAASDILQEAVDVPEWGGRVLVRGLSGAERDRFEASIIDTRGKDRQSNLKNIRAKMVVFSVIDADGKRLFEDHDVARLGDKSARALQRVYDVAMRLSGLTEADAEELAKNSESDPSEGLSSV